MKVGILTHYYHSLNYGGNLQAYALPTAIKKYIGIEAEQVSYLFINNTKKRSLFSTVKMFPKHPRSTLISLLQRFRIEEIANDILQTQFDKRVDEIYGFNDYITPHSSRVFTEKTLNACASQYDVLIVGSDQVWSGCSEAFTLSFSSSARKISYSASIARDEISEKHKDFLRSRLRDFYAISVRNEIDYNIVSQLSDKIVEITIDPVFLLTMEDWDLVVDNKKCINEKYIFCYFLGDSLEVKKAAIKFAKKHQFKVLFIPHFRDNENGFVKNDLVLGRYGVYDVSPSDFLGLIKHAEYIFTDSFHCAAMSIIFRKEFFVFDRISKWGKMNSRIIRLLYDFHCTERYFEIMSAEEIINRIEMLNRIDYNKVFSDYQEKRDKSLLFLKSGITGE